MIRFVPSPQQANIFAYVANRNGGSAIVEAVAGAGKTTTLVEALKLMIGSVFLGAYNTKMAKELRERTSGLSNVKVMTFHAAGMNALRRAVDIKGDPDPKKVEKLCELYINTKGRMDLQPIVKTVADVVSMAKQRGIGVIFPDRIDIWEDMIEHFDLAEDLPEVDSDIEFEKMMAEVIKMASDILRWSIAQVLRLGIIDFDDMVYMPLQMNLRMFKNDWVLIDEAQDTNPTRRELAKRMLKPGGRLIAVGDPRQAIYGFSGADNDALDQIARDFNARSLPLTVTYRCPKAVVRVAQQFVSHIEAHETAPEGEYKSIHYDKVLEEVRPGDAILCRYNKYLVNLCFKLIRAGRPARIEGRAIGAGLLALAGKWKVKTLEELAGRVRKWMDTKVEEALKEGKEQKADQIADRAETLLVLIERAQEQGVGTPAGLRKLVTDMFDDRVVDNKSMITLCSVHRSKGLEFPRVFILGLFELMGRECRLPWQTVQEQNLQYVGSTRAQELLVDVYGVKQEEKQHFSDDPINTTKSDLASMGGIAAILEGRAA